MDAQRIVCNYRSSEHVMSVEVSEARLGQRHEMHESILTLAAAVTFTNSGKLPALPHGLLPRSM